jgi:hypothetical protein
MEQNFFLEEKTDIRFLYYSPWENNGVNLGDIVEDVKKYNPTEIIVSAPEEWEIGGFFGVEEYVAEINEIVHQKNIKITVILGSDDLGFYKGNKNTLLPTKNTKVVLWPTFWLYYTYRIFFDTQKKLLFEKNPVTPEKHFITLNNKAHFHRSMLLDEMFRYGLIDNCYFSWVQAKESDGYCWKYWTPEQILFDDDYVNTINSYVKIPDEYFKTAFNVVMESTTNLSFITEKTATAILFNKPFIILGSKGIHNSLKKMGFLLYDEIFDYSFDNYESLEMGVEGIINNLLNVKQIPPTTLWEMTKKKAHINKNFAALLIKHKQQIPKEVMEIKNKYGHLLKDKPLIEIIDYGCS